MSAAGEKTDVLESEITDATWLPMRLVREKHASTASKIGVVLIAVCGALLRPCAGSSLQHPQR